MVAHAAGVASTDASRGMTHRASVEDWLLWDDVDCTARASQADGVQIMPVDSDGACAMGRFHQCIEQFFGTRGNWKVMSASTPEVWHENISRRIYSTRKISG